MNSKSSHYSYDTTSKILLLSHHSYFTTTAILLMLLLHYTYYGTNTAPPPPNQRAVGFTDMNSESSRSHSIFALYLRGFNEGLGSELHGQ